MWVVIFALFSLIYAVLVVRWRPVFCVRKPGNDPMSPVDSAMIADLACAVLNAGASIPAALECLDEALAEEKDERGLTFVARSLILGASWDEAWDGVAERFDVLRDSLEPSWTSGAAAIPLLERHASGIRAARQRHAREAAATLGARLVLPLGLCFLPAFILVGVIPIVASAGMGLFGR